MIPPPLAYALAFAVGARVARAAGPSKRRHRRDVSSNEPVREPRGRIDARPRVDFQKCTLEENGRAFALARARTDETTRRRTAVTDTNVRWSTDAVLDDVDFRVLRAVRRAGGLGDAAARQAGSAESVEATAVPVVGRLFHVGGVSFGAAK